MSSLKYPYRSFQKVYPQTVDSIRTNGFIINPNNKEIKYNNLLWDTGATCTSINTHVIKDLNLLHSSVHKVTTASGEILCPFYYVHIRLPHKVRFQHLFVAGLPLEKDIDALIGMDIINQGSFLFSQDKQTRKFFFEFSIPPIHKSIHTQMASTKNKK